MLNPHTDFSQISTDSIQFSMRVLFLEYLLKFFKLHLQLRFHVKPSGYWVETVAVSNIKGIPAASI